MASGRVQSWLRGLRTPAVGALIAVFLIQVMSYADRSVLTVLQEDIKADLKLTDFQLGLLAGPVFAIFYGIMGIPIARLAERRNRKRIVLAGLCVWSMFTAMCGLAQNFLQLVLLRMGVGAAEAAAPPAMHSLIADYFPRSARGRAMALLALGIPLGLMLGGALGGLIGQVTNWRIAFIAIGLPGILIAVLGQKLMYEAKRTPDHAQAEVAPMNFGQSLKSLLSIPVYRLLLVAAVFSGNASHAISAFSASYFIRTHELSTAEVGGILLVGKGIFGMLGTVFGGFASDKLDRGLGTNYLLVPAFGSALAGVVYWLSLNLTHTAFSMAAFMFASFFASMIISPAFAAVQNVVDMRTRATAAALFLFCITVPGSIGPVVVGIVSDMAAASSVGMEVAAFSAACPGGVAAAGVVALSDAACRTAANVGLQTGMLVGIGLYVGVAFVYLMAVFAGRRSLA